VKILFVCMGNICRSPTAHGVFESMLSKHHLGKRVMVDSAGTGPWHAGKAPDSRAQEAAKSRGYRLDHLRARQVKVEDFIEFDLVLAMDEHNIAELMKKCPEAYRDRVKLFLTFGSQSDHLEVPDPYYGGQRGFELVLDLIENASRGLIEHVKKQSE